MLLYTFRPENIPRLFDLVNIPDKKISTAFYYGLKNTLVANDLEQAKRIGYKVPIFDAIRFITRYPKFN